MSFGKTKRTSDNLVREEDRHKKNESIYDQLAPYNKMNLF